jgi:MFS family permease
MFVLPIYGKEIGADAVEIGLFFSAFSLMTVLMRPIIGAALDRCGRRRFFLTGLIGYAVTMFAFALSDQVWGVVVARTCQGIASAFMWLALSAIIADVAGADQRGHSFGSVTQAGTQGEILGVFVGLGVLIPLGIVTGWTFLFAGYGVMGLIAAFLTWRRLPETNPAIENKVPRPLVWSRALVLLLLVTAVTGAAWAMVSPILMIFLQDKLTANVEELAWAFFPSGLVWALMPARLGKLADHFGRKPLMVLGTAAAAITSFLIPSLTSLGGLAVLWAFQALCYAAGDPAEQALIADLTGGDQRGRAYGLYAMVAGLGATIGPLVGGWLYENVGPQAPFFANGIVLAVCTIIMLGGLNI